MPSSFDAPLKQALNSEAIQRKLKLANNKWHNAQGLKIMDNLNALPKINSSWKVDKGSICLQTPEELTFADQSNIKKTAQELKNWKKGPWNIFDLFIDSEWQCQYKWERIINRWDDFKGDQILDIGCNNGYFMFRMLEAGAKNVLGIDPTLIFKAQFLFIQHFAKDKRLQMELLGVEDLVHMKQCFDTIFSMGILYHHRSPLQQLIEIREALRPGGKLLLETIGIPGDGAMALCPQDRYCGMKNIYFIPTINGLTNWLYKARFNNIEVLETSWGQGQEQRSTAWTSPVSYPDFLSPQDQSLTQEGYPAPQRFIVLARKKKT